MPQPSPDNPLLDVNAPIAFDTIDHTCVRSSMDALLTDARASLRALAQERSARTYANTMRALEEVTEPLQRAITVVGHLESVCTSPELRDAYNEVQPKVSAFFSEIPLDAGVWEALSRYASSSEAERLRGAQARFVARTVDEFRREGAELDPSGKRRLAELQVELTELTTRFGQNVLDATNAFELLIEDEAQLDGLPDSAREAARADARSKGLAGYRFTLQAPSFLPVMLHLADAGVREQMYRAYNTRATEGRTDNRPLIARILELRRDKAKLLGYASFADLVLADRMAKDGESARVFVEDLRKRSQEAFELENRQLLEFRQQLEGPAAAPLQPWDLHYYAEKLRRQQYDFDDEVLRPYFELERTLNGLFELASSLFGVKVVADTGLPVWHPSVRAFGLVDEDGTRLGSFYADLFPRESKRDGAWMNHFITAQHRDGVWDQHVGTICANLTPPVGVRPSLLTHREIETLFHEFGHLLHHLLSRVEVPSLAGTNVAWDFVELPSQIMENWCWDRDTLTRFAQHHVTGEPLPEELFERMLRARTYRGANAMMRQLGFAALDLGLHIDYQPTRDGDVMQYARSVAQRYSPVELPAAYAMLAGFTHLFSSPVAYAAGYYSYKWAEVLDADAFSRFVGEGVRAREVGRDFRDTILSRGNSDDPMTLFKSFMGRAPKLDALLVRSGIAPSST